MSKPTTYQTLIALFGAVLASMVILVAIANNASVNAESVASDFKAHQAGQVEFERYVRDTLAIQRDTLTRIEKKVNEEH